MSDEECSSDRRYQNQNDSGKSPQQTLHVARKFVVPQREMKASIEQTWQHRDGSAGTRIEVAKLAITILEALEEGDVLAGVAGGAQEGGMEFFNDGTVPAD